MSRRREIQTIFNREAGLGEMPGWTCIPAQLPGSAKVSRRSQTSLAKLAPEFCQISRIARA